MNTIAAEIEIEQTELEDDGELAEIPLERRRLITESKDLSIRELHIQHQEGDLSLNPDFQRFYVFTDKQASSLIESVLLDVPLPVVYLSQEQDNTYSVIDGQQRLTSFMRFLDNQLPLKGLRAFSELNGKRFRDLDRELQAKIKKSTIRCIIVQSDSDPIIKFDIFERLNSGSVQLNSQELRNCLYRGSYNDLTRDLSHDRDWQQLIGMEGTNKRMKDREMILRFFALYHSLPSYSPPMREFLNTDARTHQHATPKLIEEMRRLFKKSVQLSLTVFGKLAFRRFAPGNDKSPDAKWENKSLNMALFDVIMVGFTSYEMRDIVPKADAIRNALFDLIATNQAFYDNIVIGTSERMRLQTRFTLWQHALHKAVGMQPHDTRLFSQELLRTLYQANQTCSICDQRIMSEYDAVVDHTRPWSLGGATEPANGRLTHRYCNWARGNRT